MYGRRRYYGGYSGRTRRRASAYSSRSKRRAIGNFKAANKQTDSTQVNLSIPTQITASFKHNSIALTSDDTVDFASGVYALNIWDLLRKSTFYQSYAHMYDQVKIDGIRVKITPIKWSFNTGNSAVSQAITVVTAWDRTGLSPDQVQLVARNVSDGSGEGSFNKPQYKDIIGTPDTGNVDGLYVSIGNQISTYSSAITKNLNPGSSFNLTRSLYPNSLQEKSLYVNTNDLDQWYTAYDGNNGRFIGIEEPLNVVKRYSTQENTLPATVELGNALYSNPCYLMEASAVPFKPTLLIGLIGPETDLDLSFGADSNFNDFMDVGPVTFNVEADVAVTFRGLRKSAVVS